MRRTDIAPPSDGRLVPYGHLTFGRIDTPKDPRTCVLCNTGGKDFLFNDPDAGGGQSD